MNSRLGHNPISANFPRRNRIISGLSHGTLWSKPHSKAGPLITASVATEQNRQVSAIRGPIHNPSARGRHQLIRQGAKLVETAQDILEEMASVIDLKNSHNTIIEIAADQMATTSNKNSNADSAENNLNPEQQVLLEHMGFDPVSIDQLAMRSGLNSSEIAAMLLILELQNQIASNGGGTYTRLK